jgi:hypothetical protein
MRTALVLIAILVILGTAALHYGSTRGQLGEWRAAPLPYPGAGFASHETFHLYRGGRFELNILSPCTDRERNQVVDETASTKLHVVIHSGHGFHLDKTIESVCVGSWSALSRTFSSNEMWSLSAGDYEIRIENRGPVSAVFRERGAVIYLARMEPVGPDLGIELSKLTGYGLLLTAAVFAVFLAVRNQPSARGSTRHLTLRSSRLAAVRWPGASAPRFARRCASRSRSVQAASG